MAPGHDPPEILSKWQAQMNWQDSRQQLSMLNTFILIDLIKTGQQLAFVLCTCIWIKFIKIFLRLLFYYY